MQINFEQVTVGSLISLQRFRVSLFELFQAWWNTRFLNNLFHLLTDLNENSNTCRDETKEFKYFFDLTHILGTNPDFDNLPPKS